MSEKPRQIETGKSKRIILIVATSLVAIFGVWRWMRRLAIKLVTQPPRAQANQTPTDYNLPYEEVWFNSRDGVRLQGWFIAAPNSKATIILGHGHVSRKEPSLGVAAFLGKAGYSTFLFDFRGHGQSGEAGVSISYQERLDVHGAVDYLLGRGENRIGMYGFSMGAAIGIIATAENPHIKALIADSAFAYLHSSVAAHLRNLKLGIPRWLSVLLAHFAVRTVAGYFGYDHKFAHPVTFVGQIAPRPIFIIHGELDKVTPLVNAYLLDAAAQDPKELWIQPGIAHCDGFNALGQLYQQRILDFLDKVNWAEQSNYQANFQPAYL